VHYKNPVLLIEFEEDKAFSLEVSSNCIEICMLLTGLQIVSDMKVYGKQNNRFQSKRKPTGSGKGGERSETETNYASNSVQSKIVLLTLSFPRVRIIWSSSPYATAEIFKDLKADRAEPDAAKAILVGAEEDAEAGAGVNSAAEELLRSLPGITTKNVKYVMNRVNNMRELCEMDMKQMQDLLGVEPGKTCWQFIHKGERQ